MRLMSAERGLEPLGICWGFVVVSFRVDYCKLCIVPTAPIVINTCFIVTSFHFKVTNDKISEMQLINPKGSIPTTPLISRSFNKNNRFS